MRYQKRDEVNRLTGFYDYALIRLYANMKSQVFFGSSIFLMHRFSTPSKVQ